MRVCCICNKKARVLLTFAIPRKDKPSVLDYVRRWVCSPACAEVLTNQGGEP